MSWKDHFGVWSLFSQLWVLRKSGSRGGGRKSGSLPNRCAGVSGWAECEAWATAFTKMCWVTLMDLLWETGQRGADIGRQGGSRLRPPFCHPPSQFLHHCCRDLRFQGTTAQDQLHSISFSDRVWVCPQSPGHRLPSEASSSCDPLQEAVAGSSSAFPPGSLHQNAKSL